MATIFVSYNRRSEVIAQVLVRDIEALGHTAWFDQELSGGQAWWDQILARVRDCNVFVFVLNPESLDSTACKREYGYAADLGKPILPVLASGDVSTNLLPPALTQIQYVDYRNQDRDSAFRLARALATVPPSNALPDPLPDPPKAPLSYLGGLAERIEGSLALSYEDQSALVVDLKRGLRDPETAHDAWTLLERLRKRRDVYATFDKEIEEIADLRRTMRKVPSDPPVASRTEAPRHETWQKTWETVSEPIEGKLLASQKPQPLSPLPISTSTDRKPAWRERIREARNLAFTGIAIGLLCMVVNSVRFRYGYMSLLLYQPWYLLALGGAIAGAITGMDRKGIVAARVAMAVVAVLVLVAWPFYGPVVFRLGILVPPMGGVIGMYITKRKVRM